MKFKNILKILTTLTLLFVSSNSLFAQWTGVNKNFVVKGNLQVSGSVQQEANASASTYTIGSNGTFATIKDAIAWLKVNMTRDVQLRLGQGVFECDTTIVINLPYSVQFLGMNSTASVITPSTGFNNKPLFCIESETFFDRLSLSSNDVATFGNDTTEVLLQVCEDSIYVECQNMAFYGGYDNVKVTACANVFIFNVNMDSPTNSCVKLTNYTGTKGDITGIDVEVANMSNYTYGFNFINSPDTANLIINHIVFFNNNTTDTCIKYGGANVKYDIFNVFNCTFNHIGKFIGGFDFTLASGRDADIEMVSNIGLEDKTPHAKVNVVGFASTQALTSGTWAKSNFTNTSSYTCKWKIENNKVTFLSNHEQSIWMMISGRWQTTTQPATIDIAIVKNNSTVLTFGQMTLFMDVNNRAFNFSTNVYLDDVNAGDFYEIFLRPVGSNETVITSDINWGIFAQ